jgi:hypothetical protein
LGRPAGVAEHVLDNVRGEALTRTGKSADTDRKKAIKVSRSCYNIEIGTPTQETELPSIIRVTRPIITIFK